MSEGLTWKMGSARFLGLHYWVGSDGLGWIAAEITTSADLGSHRVEEDARAACEADLDERMAQLQCGSPGTDAPVTPANRFDSYSLADLAGQCRMQARETLDPELTDFWMALHNRLKAIDAALSSGAEVVVPSGISRDELPRIRQTTVEPAYSAKLEEQAAKRMRAAFDRQVERQG